jgi:hypothetical protein
MFVEIRKKLFKISLIVFQPPFGTLHSAILLADFFKKVMEFPPSWEVFEMEEFSTAGPRVCSDLGMELLMQARPNGRMLDHYRITLGGSRILDINFQMAAVMSLPAAAKWSLRHQVWPKDIEIRRNMTTSCWVDIDSLLASNDALVMDDSHEPVETKLVLEAMKAAGVAASIRFAVVVGEDLSMRLQLQGLPATSTSLQAKPALRG